MAQLNRIPGDPQIQRNFEQLQKNIKDENIAGNANIQHRKMLTTVLKDKTITSAELAFAHGLGVVPLYVTFTMKAAGVARLSSSSARPTATTWFDATNVYVTCNLATSLCDIIVHG